MGFSERDKRILENFVTSADDQIYAIRNTVPSEVFGAFGSYFSRNPEDFRFHLLRAIKGQITKNEKSIPEYDLDWLAECGDVEELRNFVYETERNRIRENGGILDIHASDEIMGIIDRSLRLVDPSKAIERGLRRSRDFFEKWYGKYGHRSIANMVWIPMVANNVSQLFARELAYEQLAFFIEQSTRYVKWGRESFMFDRDVMQSPEGKTMKHALEFATDNYFILSDIACDFFENRNPFDQWLEKQSDEMKTVEEKVQRATYEREIKGAALDVSRFLTTQACQTNIAFILDARSAEFDNSTLKKHPLREIRTLVEVLERNARQIVPSLLKYTEANEYYGDKLNGSDGYYEMDEVRSFGKGVDVISFDKDALDKSLANIMRRHGTGGTFRNRYERVKGMSFERKMQILRRAVRDRGRYDEWVETDEDFDLIKIAFEIRSDIGAIRDWRRHQKFDRGEPGIYTLDNGVHRPDILVDLGREAEDTFDRTIEVLHDAEIKIRRHFPFQAQYVVPMAAMHSLTMSGGLDQVQYLLWTRTTPEGNFSYREDAFNLAEAIAKVHPWLLGYEKYPEGRSFRQVYDEAPLKGLLRLQTGETTLHS